MIISTIEQSAIDFYTENVNYVSGFGLINLEREERRLYNKGKNIIAKLQQFKKDSEKNVKWTAEEYKRNRIAEYPHFTTQLDYIYHNGIEKWKTDMIDPIKAKYPKPS